ncbi:MAG: hypothetical protein ACTHN7_01525 [Solirubrobacterales bacterium]
MACFPSLVQAKESSGIQYESEVPTVPTHESSNIPSAKHHGGSEGNPEATGSGPSSGGGSGGNGGSHQGGGGTSNGQSKQASTGGNRSANDGSKPAAGAVGESRPLVNASQPVEGGSEGSSSPLVPILIAIAVLAAISIGAFYFRQRRQGPDSPVSPKAS